MKITILGVEMEASYKVLYATPEISKEYIQAMKDTNGKIITEEEFMKDIGHGVVGGGKRDWKEKLWYRIEQKHLSLDNENYDELFEVVESLLEEQRKEVYAEAYMQGVAVGVTNGQKGLIETILSEAPEDRKPVQIDDEAFTFADDTEFNKCNQLWRSLLTKHLI